MRLRLMVLMLAGIAGAVASYALADGGRSHSQNDPNGKCSHVLVLGTAAAPQSLTLTVTKAGRHSGLTAGQPATLAVGATGQTVRVVAEGCVGTGGTLTVRQVVLHVEAAQHGKGHHKHGPTGTTGPTGPTGATGPSGATGTSTND